MKKRFLTKSGSATLIALALLGMFSSCAEKRNAEREAVEETEELKIEEQASQQAPVDTLAAIDAMVSAVESSQSQLQTYNGAFFTNNANASKTPAEGKYTTTESGLKYVIVTPGEGVNPKATDNVTVHYTGMLTDGTVFDSSVARGEPTTFPLNGVIPGWTEGLQLMRPGGMAVFYIPSELAYGERGVPGAIPGGAPLIFWVQLLQVN